MLQGRMIGGLLLAAAFSMAAEGPVAARAVCTMVADAVSSRVLIEEGDCRTRVTPASTFKLALAVMGFEEGFLKDAHAPELAYRKGDPDWGGEAWRRPNDPASWLKHSVVWYSQRIAHALGAETLTRHARAFGYGNADFSGDPGKNNGLDRSWISSSLRVSPAEQVAFLNRLVRRELGLKSDTYRKLDGAVERHSAGGWTVHGKTGSAFPRKADGSLDRAHGYGWYVGWAQKDGRTVVFARLNQDERAEKRPGGLRAREAMLTALPMLVRGR